MDFRLIMILVFVGVLVLNWAMSHLKHIEIYLQIICLLFLIFKTCDYVRVNMVNTVTFPVEFSAVSYFVISIIVACRFRSGYPIASFLGIVAGLSFMIYYIIGGSNAASVFGRQELITSIISHSFLLTSGLQLFLKYKFNPSKYFKIWIAILGMIFNAFAFYDIRPRGTTFVYYIIRPDYLKVYDDMRINMLLMIAFYILLVAVFGLVVKLFYVTNALVHKKDKKLSVCEKWG